MKRIWMGWAGLLLGATVAFAQAPERWLHVRVVSTDAKGEMVRVNVPISVAEQVLPAINANKLHNGRVEMRGKLNNIDLAALLDAVRKSPDNEFVTVQSQDEHVRVAKSGDYLIVKVLENKGSEQQVDIKVPIPVVNALLSGGKDELNLLAALHALKSYGDLDLVKVTEKDQTVRIWVDARNTVD